MAGQKWILLTMQWCTFPLVSCQRLIKMPKGWLFQPPSGPWSDRNSSSVGLMSHCFCDAGDMPALVFRPNSSLKSVQNTDVVTSASRLQWHRVLAEVSGYVQIVEGQSTLYFVGCKAELGVSSWSETTLWQLFQDWMSVMWTSTFHVLFTTTNFISARLVSYCFCIVRTACPIKIGLKDTLSC